MTKFALFIGCQIPARVPQYELAARAVLKRLNVELVDIRQFNCCGYPMRNVDQKSYLLSSLRNLALAEKQGLDILVLCKCCFGSLKKAQHLMKDGGRVQDEVLKILDEMNLAYSGRSTVSHLLSVLHDDLGIDAIKSKVTRSFKDLNIATHYGCHALRPSSITEFDDPVAPTLFDELVNVTGAKSIVWNNKLDCCGAPLMGINDEMSMKQTKIKLDAGREAGAGYLCTACPYCQIQFDTVQKMILSKNGNSNHLASILYPQLLGVAMGISPEKLGMDMNLFDLGDISSYLSEE